MNEIRLYGKNRKRVGHRRSYWTDIAAWRREREAKTGNPVATVNVTSRARDFGRGLSPILLGPVDTYREGGKMLSAVSVEVAWQYSKIYSHQNVGGKLVPLAFLGRDGRPNRKWFAWRNKAWGNPAFVWGHPKFAANKRLVRRAFPKGSTVVGWFWRGKVLDAVTARREIYAMLYCKAVQQSPAYRQLQALYAKGDVAIFDLDGYDYQQLGFTPEDTIHDLDHSWGHGLLLTFMLQGIDPRSLGKDPHHVLPLLPPAPGFVVHSRSATTQSPIMDLKKRRELLKAKLAEVDRQVQKEEEALHARLTAIVKRAGYKSLQAYVQQLSPAAPSKAAKGPRAKNSGKRARITAEQVAKMKELRAKGLSHAKVGKQVGTSTMSVFNWEKKGFRFEK